MDIKNFNWRTLLQYQWMVKQLPFIMFLLTLAILYIANGHFADKTIRNIGQKRAELKQLQYEYKVVKADIMFRSKESQVVAAVDKMGLKRLDQPAALLKDTAK